MELEGETTVEGSSVDRLISLQNVRATLALMRTPDDHGCVEESVTKEFKWNI